MKKKQAQMRAEQKGTTVYIDGVPTLLLETPIATRPQDWTPTQAAVLFTETELARSRTARRR